MQQWFCKRCRANKPAILEKGRPKTRRFFNGYVAVFLSCGHTAAVKQDRR
jgi:hypothetical protein